MRGLRSYFVLIVAILFCATTAHAEKRVALVIGNSAYEHVPALPNPRNDAADMAAKLESLGFEVVTGEDLDLSAMRKLAREFTNKLEGADLALFFYAGHGLQVNGNNYMAPVDARLASYDDLDYEVLPMDLVLGAMERKTKTSLVFLDACRDNPLAENLARSMGTRSGSVGRGLAKLGTGIGTLIAFATQPGNVALDGTGRNSPFTTALLKHLGTPGQSVTDELIQVRREVLAATQGKQVPWDNSSLTGEVILKEAAKQEAKVEPAPEVKAPETANNSQLELAYWNSIKDGGNVAYFEAYLQQYPNGTFSGLARVRIDEIKGAEERARQVAAAKAEADAKAKVEADQKPVEVAKLEDPAVRSLDPAELAIETQRELIRLGCLSGRADGKWGNGSEKALKDYAGRQGIQLASLDPAPDLLDRLKATTVRVCPLVCGKGMEERNGRCERARKEATVEPKQKSDQNGAAASAQKSLQSNSERDCFACKRFGTDDILCVKKGQPFKSRQPGDCKKI